MKPTPPPPCPECEKLSAIAPQSQIVGEFLEWLTQDKGYCIAEENLGDSSETLIPVYTTTEKLLAEHFGIDLNKVEKERRALLEFLSEQNKHIEPVTADAEEPDKPLQWYKERTEAMKRAGKQLRG